jgi:aminoglycoside phosphotransferase (APT) family kinase protein
VTVPAGPTARTSACAADHALHARSGPEPIARFLHAVAPGEVLRAVRPCLPPGDESARLQLVRAKLKPDRKLTAEYDLVLPLAGVERRIWVTWVAAGRTAPGPAAEQEAEARRSGVLAPFRRSWAASHDGRMSVSVAPVDGGFPQLIRLHDPAHLTGLLRAAGVAGPDGVGSEDVTVSTVRYRPGQRHVLRVRTRPGGPAWFVKVYRDDTGRRAVAAAARAATAFAAGGAGTPAVASGGGVYVATDRVAVWPEVTGASLADVLLLSGTAAEGAVRAAGRALRLVHDEPPGEELPSCPDAAAEAGATLRTAQLLEVLLPAVGAQLREGVSRVLDVLSRSPVERPTTIHGDFKCENLLVSDSRVHVLDFDRSGRGDPAADIGKFLADLRWWTDECRPTGARLREAFLRAYGATEPARLARARAYDALLQFRMAARRVPIQHPDWERRVTGAIGGAVATLAEEP